MVRRGVAGLALVLMWAAFAAGFSKKPVYIDPALGGWVAPLQTLCFQAGCGELYYVAGVWLDRGGDLMVLSRAKVTFRRFDRRSLGRFAQRLARALGPTVAALHRQGRARNVVLIFYCPQLRGNVITLEVYESRLPASAFEGSGPVPLKVVERRSWALPPP
ncbi:MAG: hypothetical protein GXP50_02775 [Deltaproteobacteria bacterium]|nr:hypothetical protein [Deltaproteobacteria bacterium]